MSNGNYATINGLNIYYEIHGNGYPLVLLHGGGSTIETTYGRILPELSKSFQVIAVELQAHGRTQDIDRPLSFEQDADDVAGLLQHLGLEKVNIMGFSNGGTTVLQLAIRHPQMVNKLVPCSAVYKRDGMIEGFWDGMQHASMDNMPGPLKEAFLKVNPDQQALEAMFNRDKARMLAFKDIEDSLIHSIQAPTLVINGDRDVIRNEHALEMSRTLPDARLAILPAGHGDYIGEICSPSQDSKLPMLVVDMIKEFLEK